MSEKHNTGKKNVVIVGGGSAGFNAAKNITAKIGFKYNVVLVTARPYFVHPISAIRMTVSDVGNLDKQTLIPYDKLTGIVHKVGTVTSIEETAPGEGGQVVFADGERLAYAALLLATGSSWSGPVDVGTTDEEIRSNINSWRSQFAKAKHVVIVGGGAVGIETVGEIKDAYPNTQVTLVHSQAQLLNEVYPDKFRRVLDQKVRARGAKIIYGDYVDQFPEPGQITDITTRRGQLIKAADLVVPAFGSRPNTAFINSLGSGVLTETGTVKVKPTLELLHHSGIFAAGDIIEWKEMKQMAKAPKHAGIAAANIISFLTGQPQKAIYKGQRELIVIPIGEKVGSSYFDLLWGITLGNFLTSLLKGKGLFVSATRKELGYQ